MNRFINENWQDFLKELLPTVKKIVTGLIDNVYSGYLNTVPKKDIFLP